MADWQKVATVAEIVVGTGKEVVIGGRIVALFNVDGQVHAMDGICAHQGGPLAKGKLDGTVVTCPWHGWRFDVTTGSCMNNPSSKVEAYQVKIEGNDVKVLLDV